MAQTTTAFNACDAVIELDNLAGTLTDISGSTNSVTLEFTNDLGEYKTFGNRWRGRLECGSDATFTVNIVSSTAAGEAWDILQSWYWGARGARSFRVSIPDDAVGSWEYDAEVLIETYSQELPSDDGNPVITSVTLRPTGTITCDEIAS